MKALVGVFNQEKALVGAFSVIVKTGCGTDGTLHNTNPRPCPRHLMLQPLLATPALKSPMLEVSWRPVRRRALSWVVTRTEVTRGY